MRPNRQPPDSSDESVPSQASIKRQISLDDVALLAGVSSSTVSRALSKSHMVSETTRTRILEAVNRLGYVANGAARALAMRRTMTIGAVVPRFGSSSFPTMVQALESTLAAQRYTLLLAAPEHHSVQEPMILRALLERGVDAIALLGAEHSREVFATLAAHNTPFVMMWASDSKEGDCIGFDEEAAAALLVNHLADLGHSQVGFIGGRTDNNERAARRLLGLTSSIAKRGLILNAEALIETDYGFREGFDAMTDIINRKAPITAVVCGNDYLAAGALSALDRAGIRVPQDLSIASFNDNDFAAYLHPPLTTVRLPIKEIGEMAGSYLITRLHKTAAPVPDPLAVQLMVRSSTGCAPTGATFFNPTLA